MDSLAQDITFVWVRGRLAELAASTLRELDAKTSHAATLWNAKLAAVNNVPEAVFREEAMALEVSTAFEFTKHLRSVMLLYCKTRFGRDERGRANECSVTLPATHVVLRSFFKWLVTTPGVTTREALSSSAALAFATQNAIMDALFECMVNGGNVRILRTLGVEDATGSSWRVDDSADAPPGGAGTAAAAGASSSGLAEQWSATAARREAPRAGHALPPLRPEDSASLIASRPRARPRPRAMPTVSEAEDWEEERAPPAAGFARPVPVSGHGSRSRSRSRGRERRKDSRGAAAAPRSSISSTQSALAVARHSASARLPATPRFAASSSALAMSGANAPPPPCKPAEKLPKLSRRVVLPSAPLPAPPPQASQLASSLQSGSAAHASRPRSPSSSSSSSSSRY